MYRLITSKETNMVCFVTLCGIWFQEIKFVPYITWNALAQRFQYNINEIARSMCGCRSGDYGSEFKVWRWW